VSSPVSPAVAPVTVSASKEGSIHNIADTDTQNSTPRDLLDLKSPLSLEGALEMDSTPSPGTFPPAAQQRVMSNVHRPMHEAMSSEAHQNLSDIAGGSKTAGLTRGPNEDKGQASRNERLAAEGREPTVPVRTAGADSQGETQKPSYFTTKVHPVDASPSVTESQASSQAGRSGSSTRGDNGSKASSRPTEINKTHRTPQSKQVSHPSLTALASSRKPSEASNEEHRLRAATIDSTSDVATRSSFDRTKRRRTAGLEAQHRDARVPSTAALQPRNRILSKDFWMRDENCKECFHCGDTFSAFRRKHHCRKCSPEEF
jgi:1-phosphatidylinositol-3-phosphate 5-kinase